MGKYHFLQPYLWSEKQNHFLKPRIIFPVKFLFLFSVTLNFSLLQMADAITSEKNFQPDDVRITQLLATHYDCSKQYKLR